MAAVLSDEAPELALPRLPIQVDALISFHGHPTGSGHPCFAPPDTSGHPLFREGGGMVPASSKYVMHGQLLGAKERKPICSILIGGTNLEETRLLW